MNTTTMDTLKYTKRFEGIGFNRPQSEELAEILFENRSEIISQVKNLDNNYATKGDVKDLEHRLSDDIKALDNKISLLTQRVDSLPDKLFNRILLAGGAIITVYKLIEFILPLILKSR